MCQCDLALLLLFIVMVNDVQGLNRRGITERPSATCSSSSLARLLVGRGESSPPPAGSRWYIISPFGDLTSDLAVSSDLAATLIVATRHQGKTMSAAPTQPAPYISPLKNQARNPTSHSGHALGFQCRLVLGNYRNSSDSPSNRRHIGGFSSRGCYINRGNATICHTSHSLTIFPSRMADETESDPQACTEDQVKAMLARSPVGAKLSRWVSCGKGSVAAVRRASGTVSQACTRARPRMQALTLTASPTAHPAANR